MKISIRRANNHRARLLAQFLSLFLPLMFVGRASAQQQQAPLAPEAIVNDVDFFPMESISPSPDGKWIAYEAADPTHPIRFDYENQRFAKSGYPMNAGSDAISVWVTEVATGQVIQMVQTQGSSWMPSWSPDSRYLAFYSDRSGAATVWVWDRQTKAARQVSDAATHSTWWRTRPVWSADGKSLLCPLLPEGKTLVDLLTMAPGIYPDPNAQSAKVDLKAPSVHVYEFHPDQQPKTKAPIVPSAPASSTDELEGTVYADALYLSDLARIDIATGKVTRLMKGVRAMCFAYSPDQKYISALTMEGSTPHTQQSVYSIRVYDVQDQTTRVVAKGFLDANNLTTRMNWSPDSKRIAYSDTGKTAERAAYVVDVKTAAKVKVPANLPPSSLDFTWGPPLWARSGEFVYLLDDVAGKLWQVTADGQSAREVVTIPGLPVRDLATAETEGTYWSPDAGKTLYVRAHDDTAKKDEIFSVRVESGEWTKLFEGDEAIGMREQGAFTGSASGVGLLISCSESASHPSEVWGLDLGTRQPRRLSRLNPQYDSATLGKVRIIDWLTLQGEHVRGSLLLPADYREGTRYPMVVFAYGGINGSDSANRFAFGWGSAFNPQMWASRGYAVLYPDIPLHPGSPVDDVVSAVVTGVNKTVELGIADPSRLALSGQSFGGYNTIAMITRTSIFKAAIATSPANTDLFSAYTEFFQGIPAWIGYYEEGQGGMKGTPWEFKERYYDNSPLFFLDRVTTPLLIERGSLDRISTSGENVFIALRRLGKDVELLEYDHEDHVLQQPVNVIDFWNRRIDWVNRYLTPSKPGNTPTPSAP